MELFEIPNTGGRYLVDDSGNIYCTFYIRFGKTIYYKNPKIKKQSNSGGYKSVSITICGKTVSKYVHRLVMSSFYPGQGDGMQVNHIDLNKHNNKISNLEWVTPAENITHAIKNGVFDHISLFRKNRENNKVKNGTHPWVQPHNIKKRHNSLLKRWENTGFQKLEKHEVDEIKLSNLSSTKLSKIYNVGFNIIKNIRKGKYDTWT